MKMNSRQMEEVLLTAAQSLFAVAVVANPFFSLTKAALLIVLFSTQLLNPDPWFRYLYSLLYVLLTVVVFIASRDSRESFFRLFRSAGSAS